MIKVHYNLKYVQDTTPNNSVCYMKYVVENKTRNLRCNYIIYKLHAHRILLYDKTYTIIMGLLKSELCSIEISVTN